MDTRRLFNEINRLKRRVNSLNFSILRTSFLSSSVDGVGLYNGDIVLAGTGSHSEVSGSHLVYVDSTKQWKRAHAGLPSTGSGEMIGIALSAAPQDHGILVQGLFTLSSSFISGSGGSSFAIGSQVYMSPETSGSFTTTIPSGSGQIVRVVGHSVDGNMIYFAPSPDYIEI